MKVRNRHVLTSDLLLLSAAPFLAYALRFEGFAWEPRHVHTALVFAAISVPLQLIVFFAFGLYRRLWRYASVSELELIFVGVTTAWVICAALGFFLPQTGWVEIRVPVSVMFMNTLLAMGILATPRLAMRIAGWRSLRWRQRDDSRDKRVLIAGAGVAGELVVRELISNRDLGMKPIGFVDDDKTKHGMKLANLPILGSLADVREIVAREQVHELLIAMPRGSGATVRKLVKAAYEADIKTRTVPALFEILGERVSVTAIREVQIEDLLRRDPVRTDVKAVSSVVTGHTVLVTGGGGSIGRELCLQLAAFDPGRLVVLGHGENSIFDTIQKLHRRMPDGPFDPVIADVRDEQRMRQVFEKYKPHAVFHAAAHKHVPLMEANVGEAVGNNIAGTRNVVNAAIACGTQHFVLISTDKAVRPSNVMGATKRVAEFIVHQAGVAHRRNFVSVRFGNVLGSRGSVVPIFSRQIRDGGPITVTHPDMRRYFMTIPEAVQLVLQASSLGSGGELFMLDMGDPVRIVDLARDMIRLSGLEEGSDIEIRFTGVRPGEKLYEEMFFSHEMAEPTAHPKILRARNGHSDTSMTKIESLITTAQAARDDAEIICMLRQMVPDFVPDGSATPDHGVEAIPLIPEARTVPAERPEPRRRLSVP